jgi:lipid-binding SYLF domain-containing protein
MFIIIRLSFIFPLVLLLVAAASVYADDSSKVAKKQKEIREKTTETLTWLYKLQPSAKETIENSYGYAVFSNFGMKIFVAGGGKGKGEAINNKTGKETFMKMLELQAGLGMGIKRFRVVFVFESKKVFNDFINSGWEFGGQSTAAAKLDDEGVAFAGAVTVSPGVWIYQLTEDGLALEITVKGTKYMKDDNLN